MSGRALGTPPTARMTCTSSSAPRLAGGRGSAMKTYQVPVVIEIEATDEAAAMRLAERYQWASLLAGCFAPDAALVSVDIEGQPEPTGEQGDTYDPSELGELAQL